MTFEIMKFIHVLGAIIMMGNIIVTALWKFCADNTKTLKLLPLHKG